MARTLTKRQIEKLSDADLRSWYKSLKKTENPHDVANAYNPNYAAIRWCYREARRELVERGLADFNVIDKYSQIESVLTPEQEAECRLVVQVCGSETPHHPPCVRKLRLKVTGGTAYLKCHTHGWRPFPG